MAEKSTASIIGKIIPQISRAIGRLIPATSREAIASGKAGTAAPRATPAMIARATHRLRKRSKKYPSGFQEFGGIVADARSHAVAITSATLLIQMQDVAAFAVVQLLEPQGFGIEIIKHGLNALLHVHALRLLLFTLLIDQEGDAALERLKTLPGPGLKQVPTALVTFLALEHGGCSAQLFHRPGQGNFLELTRLQQGGEACHKSTVFQKELIGEESGKIEISKLIAAIIAATDCFQAHTAKVSFLQLRETRPKQTVMLQGEILEFTPAQLLANRTAV